MNVASREMVAIFAEIAATGGKELTRAILIGWAKAVEARAMRRAWR